MNTKPIISLFKFVRSFQFLIVLLLLILLNSACDDEKDDLPPDDPIVVEVFDRYLYLSDIQAIIPNGMSENDSIIQASNFIDSWIKKQLMQRRQNLT